MSRLVWYQLIASDFSPFMHCSVDAICISADARIVELRSRIKERCRDDRLKGIPSSDIKVYSSTGDHDPLDLDAMIGLIENAKDQPVLLMVDSLFSPASIHVNCERVFSWDCQTLSTSLIQESESEDDEDAEAKTYHEIQVKYLRMNRIHGFPPMMNIYDEEEACLIFIRNCYSIIYDQLKDILLQSKGSSHIITGNPGIGKSFFFAYCSFQLTIDFPERELLINCNKEYWRYDKPSNEFVICRYLFKYKHNRNVIRLIDTFSDDPHGWDGTTLVFASLRQPEIKIYRKNKGSIEFIMPTWDLQELRLINQVQKNGLKLEDEKLQETFEKYGGVPRNICREDEILENSLEEAIHLSNLEELIEIANSKKVDASHYSHRILEMCPLYSNLRNRCVIKFLSEWIAEKVFLALDEKTHSKLVNFALLNQDPLTSSLRGKIFEFFVHRLFRNA